MPADDPLAFLHDACPLAHASSQRVKFQESYTEQTQEGYACGKRVHAGETKGGKKHSNGQRKISMGGGSGVQQPHGSTSAARAPRNLHMCPSPRRETLKPCNP
eukprot:366181-Chlamydomonas_euryale.AAC.9